MLTWREAGQRVDGNFVPFLQLFKSLKLFQNIKLKESFRDFFPTGSHSLFYVLIKIDHFKSLKLLGSWI